MSNICSVRRCEEPAVIEATEEKGYVHRYCLEHLWQVEETDTVTLIGSDDVQRSSPPTFHTVGQSIPEPTHPLPVTLTEPISSEDGFMTGWRIVHPPGVECVFPSDTKQCSCGRMKLGVVSDESSTGPSPSPS